MKRTVHRTYNPQIRRSATYHSLIACGCLADIEASNGKEVSWSSQRDPVMVRLNGLLHTAIRNAAGI